MANGYGRPARGHEFDPHSRISLSLPSTHPILLALWCMYPYISTIYKDRNSQRYHTYAAETRRPLSPPRWADPEGDV
jgi:hypothetical protein